MPSSLKTGDTVEFTLVQDADGFIISEIASVKKMDPEP